MSTHDERGRAAAAAITAARSTTAPDSSAPGGSVSDGLAALARSLQRGTSPQEVMENVVRQAVEMVDGARHGSISLVLRGRVTSAAATDEVGAAFDALQDELGEGPCLDAMRDQPVVRVDDLSTETRWPELARRAPAELGVRSMLCFQLFVHGDTLGGLNLLAAEPDAFTASSQDLGEPFAAHAAVALAGARKLDGLSLALANRDVIGQAKGILMERFKIGPDQAFAMLSRISQDRNVKLHEVAQQLTHRGDLTRP